MADNTKFDISGYVKRLPTGAIDVQASHHQFTQDLAQLVATEKTDNEVIAQAVRMAFESRKVSTLSMNQVLHYAMENLQVDQSNFNAVRDRIASYLRGNTRDFKVAKGKGGGVTWNAASPAPSAATLAPAASSIPPQSTGSIRPKSSPQHA